MRDLLFLIPGLVLSFCVCWLLVDDVHIAMIASLGGGAITLVVYNVICWIYRE